MTTLTVMTGWSPEGWDQYGRQFFETFDRHWPVDVALMVFGEWEAGGLLMDYAGRHPPRRRVTFTSLAAIEGCAEFLKRHQDNRIVCGRAQDPHHHWKERAMAAGYNWRFDAWKFCRQGFIPLYAASRCRSDMILWLDGDVVTQRDVATSEVITSLMPPGRLIAYLGREPKHPDIAFQLYDIRERPDENDEVSVPHGYVWQMLQNFAAFYRTDEVFKLPEWHSAYVWKVAVERARAWPIVHNLTPGGSGHVWQQSPLRAWGDHLKGDRKTRAR